MTNEKYVLASTDDGSKWLVTHHAPTGEQVISEQISALDAFDSIEQAMQYVQDHSLRTQRDIDSRAYQERTPTDTTIEIPVVPRS